jgi:hypothetical protein
MADEYRDLVKLLAERKISLNIDNGYEDHARALIETIFSSSKKSIKIYSGKLDKDFYGKGSLSTSFSDFLKNNEKATLEIIVDDGLRKEELTSLQSNFPGRFVFFDLSATEIRPNEGRHFIVGDGVSYREEKLHSLDDSVKECKAVANFNDPKKAGALSDCFDLAIKNIRPQLDGRLSDARR